MPFDVTTNVGYSVTLITQIIAVLKFLGIFCPSNTLFICISRYLDAFVADILMIFNDIDDKSGREITANDEKELTATFLDVIKFHKDLIQ